MAKKINHNKLAKLMIPLFPEEIGINNKHNISFFGWSKLPLMCKRPNVVGSGVIKTSIKYSHNQIDFDPDRQDISIEIRAGNITGINDNKPKLRFLGIRDMKVMDALIGVAIGKNQFIYDGIISSEKLKNLSGLCFTIQDLKNELSSVGNSESINYSEVIESLRALKSVEITLEGVDWNGKKNKVVFTPLMHYAVEDQDEKFGRAKHYVVFNPLIDKELKLRANSNYRLYQKKYFYPIKSFYGRVLAIAIIHHYKSNFKGSRTKQINIQKTLEPYGEKIDKITIFYFEKAIQELINLEILEKSSLKRSKISKDGRKIINIWYELLTTIEFDKTQKKANWLNNITSENKAQLEDFWNKS